MDFVCVLVFLPAIVLCKKFDLPSSKSRNDPPFTLSGIARYELVESSWKPNTLIHLPWYLLTNGSDLIVSDNRRFALAALDMYSPDYSSFNVLMLGSDSQGISVWRFNSESYSFKISESVGAVELKDTGNLLLHFHNDTVTPWESFHHTMSDKGHPVLLPGQIATSELHWNKMFWKFEFTCSKGELFELRYTGEQLEFIKGCQRFSLSTSKVTKPLLPYIGLDKNGDLASYRYDEFKKAWIQESLLSNISPRKNKDRFTWCPEVCNYGTQLECRICNGAACEAISWNMSYDSIILDDHSYFQVRGKVQAQYIKPNSSLEECQNGCGNLNCWNCDGTHYNNRTRECIVNNALQGPLFWLDIEKPTSTDDKPFDFKLLFLIIPVVVVIFWTLAVCSLAIVKLRMDDNPEKEIEALLASMQGLPRRYSYTSLEAATKGFSIKLGEGGFGTVYKGILAEGRVVAVKRLDPKGTDGAKQFVTEVAGIGGISHVNIVQLCGFCIEGATNWLLVYEFMPNGSLDRWLFHGESENHLSWEQRILIALGVAQGLSYLHEGCSQPILHLDIKPQNILLDEKFTVKVADFGMAKCLENPNLTEVLTRVRGTPGYMAPEWLTNFSATKKSDVFSYGMVLLELIGGRRNVDFSSQAEEARYFPAWVVKQVKQGDLLMVVDEKVRDRAGEKIQEVNMMIQLALWCIQDNPKARPSMQTVVEVLQGHLELDVAPLSLALFGRNNSFPQQSNQNDEECDTIRLFTLHETSAEL